LAALEAAGAAVGAAISIVLSTLGGYRPMTAQERTEAQLVFEDALDYDHIYFSVDDIMNDIIFGIQDFFSGHPESRAFVTDSLVNFDVDDGLRRSTMIHELTHVWQYQTSGSEYLADAVYAQATGDGVGDSGYNYGYDESAPGVVLPIDWSGNTITENGGDAIGVGGEDDLAAAHGDFDSFNPEMQAQIVMHWYARKILLNQTDAEAEP